MIVQISILKIVTIPDHTTKGVGAPEGAYRRGHNPAQDTRPYLSGGHRQQRHLSVNQHAEKENVVEGFSQKGDQ